MPAARSSCCGCSSDSTTGRSSLRRLLPQEARGASQHERLGSFDVQFDEAHGPVDVRIVEGDHGNLPLQVSGERRGVLAQQVRAPGVQRLDRKRERGRARPGAHRGRREHDAIREPVFGNGSFEQRDVRFERFEGVDVPGGSDRRSHLHGEEADVRADIDGRVARPEYAADEGDLVSLVAAADDIEADDVIGQVHEEPDAWRRPVQFHDHDGPVVGVRVVAVLVGKLSRRHEVMAQFAGVARPSKLGADDAFVLGIAIEE